MSSTSEFHFASPRGLLTIAALFVVISFCYWITTGVYNLFFHPLKHIPGPRLAALSRIPHSYHTLQGDINSWLQDLHKIYGDAVRTAPNEVSFISVEGAWSQIYGFRTGEAQKGRHFLKDRSFFGTPPPNNTWSIVQSNTPDHTRMRRLLSHAFSDKALRDQEPLIQGYVTSLIDRVREQISHGQGVLNMSEYYTFFTLDVISDLSFGESFNCLESEEQRPLARGTTKTGKNITRNSVLQRHPLAKVVIQLLFSVGGARKAFFERCKGMVDRRLNAETMRPDFIHHILKHTNSEKGLALSRDEIDSNAVVFIAAGSETTATTLAGATALLLQNPEKMSKLKEEIYGRFKDASEITIDAVFQLPYLVAVLQETLRYYPPIASGFGRIVPKGGETISDRFIPSGMIVSVSQHAAYRSRRNFAEPDAFTPERWLEDRDPRFENDCRNGVQPFSFGPRNCLGKNLAYAEMRVLLARMVFEFDMKFDRPSGDWFDQENFLLWQKPALMIKFTPAKEQMNV